LKTGPAVKPILGSKGDLHWRARRAPEAVKHAAADLRRDVLGSTASAVRERLSG